MKTESIYVANLKCSGCANTIETKLLTNKNVSKVNVDIENSLITIEHNDEVKKEELTKTLHSLGYPEATEENGLLLQLKSLKSCMVGRINK